MPDSFKSFESNKFFDAYEVENDLFITMRKFSESRLSKIEELTNKTIQDHKKPLRV
jgi:hypothetical protein